MQIRPTYNTYITQTFILKYACSSGRHFLERLLLRDVSVHMVSAGLEKVNLRTSKVDLRNKSNGTQCVNTVLNNFQQISFTFNSFYKKYTEITFYCNFRSCCSSSALLSWLPVQMSKDSFIKIYLIFTVIILISLSDLIFSFCISSKCISI